MLLLLLNLQPVLRTKEKRERCLRLRPLVVATDYTTCHSSNTFGALLGRGGIKLNSLAQRQTCLRNPGCRYETEMPQTVSGYGHQSGVTHGSH